MRKLLLIAGALYLGNVAYAQITLSSSSYPASLIGTDSLKKTVYNSPFPSFVAMSGDFCDMTSLVDTSASFIGFRVPAAGYQFADSDSYSFIGINYPANLQASNSTGFISYHSLQVFPIKYSITPLTTGGFDSLFIPEQTSFFSTPHAKLAFPATLGSSWYSSWSYDINFEVSMVAYTLYHTPCTIRHYTSESNNVIGWGKMRVNDASGFPSSYLDILQVKTVVQTVDSYFLSGSPMPPIILAAFNLVQGKTDTTYAQNFYREHEVTPLANVLFRDADFTQPYKATTHIQRLWPTAVHDVTAAQFGIFPNPLQGKMLTLQLPSSASWTYQLIDLSGTVMQLGNIVTTQQRGTLELNEAMAPGVYFLRLNDGHKVYSQQIIITR